jgi:hypothetical protein
VELHFMIGSHFVTVHWPGILFLLLVAAAIVFVVQRVVSRPN